MDKPVTKRVEQTVTMQRNPPKKDIAQIELHLEKIDKDPNWRLLEINKFLKKLTTEETKKLLRKQNNTQIIVKYWNLINQKNKNKISEIFDNLKKDNIADLEYMHETVPTVVPIQVASTTQRPPYPLTSAGGCLLAIPVEIPYMVRVPNMNYEMACQAPFLYLQN